MSAASTIPVERTGGVKLQTHTIHIEVLDGPDRGAAVSLPGPEARIGSGKECDLVLKDAAVSRVHLVVRVEGDEIRIIDAGSRNGTTLDGARVRDAYARPDSSITVGYSTLRLKMLDDVVELPLSGRERFGGLLGKSVAMRRVYSLLERVAPTDTTVLIEGETGTGKEVVAEAIHEESLRASGPFVVFDCSAVSATLIESELFGHVRGAFTGAVSERAGALEAADGGTLFLDEIGELPLDLQPKLLRALERREVRRVGSNVATRIDVRIVAATNRLLAREVERDKFREDLYYRLAVVVVPLPPLRERAEDIPILVRHFERQIARPDAPRLSDEAVYTLLARSWPGNVRELRNAVARALSLGVSPRGSVPPPPPAREGSAFPAVDLKEPLLAGRTRAADAFERAYVEAALKQAGGNVSKAAEIAQVNRKLIQRAMKQYGLRGDDDEDG